MSAAQLDSSTGLPGVRCLMNAEVAILLAAQREQHARMDSEPSQVYQKTLEYAERFSHVRNPSANTAAVTDLRADLAALTFERDEGDNDTEALTEFEITALVNLMQADSDVAEATTLVPSLQTRFRQQEVRAMLDVLNRARV